MVVKSAGVGMSGYGSGGSRMRVECGYGTVSSGFGTLDGADVVVERWGKWSHSIICCAKAL